MEERLQKLISTCGLTSRRQGEQWILDGRVTVNGKIAQLGDKADLGKDIICVDNTPLQTQEKRSYYMLNKPRGYVTTLSDEYDRKTVSDLMQDSGKRLWPVGRLDFQSEGLLIMTDDGDFTHKLLHPSHQVEKEYLVWVTGDLKKALPKLSAPMTLDGTLLAPAKVKVLEKNHQHTRLSITIHQGKNRQIRRMCTQVELSVKRLKRIREGSLHLDSNLPPGAWRPLSEKEISMLKNKGNATEKGS